MSGFWQELYPQVADGRLLATSSRGEERPLMSLPLLIRAPVLSDQDPTLMTSFNLNHPLKGPVSNTVTWGLGLQHMNERGTQFSPYHPWPGTLMFLITNTLCGEIGWWVALLTQFTSSIIFAIWLLNYLLRVAPCRG